MQFVVMAGVVGCFTAAFYGWMPLYLSELFPSPGSCHGTRSPLQLGRAVSGGSRHPVHGATGWGMFGGSYSRASAMTTLIYSLGLVLILVPRRNQGKTIAGLRASNKKGDWLRTLLGKYCNKTP